MTREHIRAAASCLDRLCDPCSRVILLGLLNTHRTKGTGTTSVCIPPRTTVTVSLRNNFAKSRTPRIVGSTPTARRRLRAPTILAC